VVSQRVGLSDLINASGPVPQLGWYCYRSSWSAPEEMNSMIARISGAGTLCFRDEAQLPLTG
jgi:hypothetical protein